MNVNNANEKNERVYLFAIIIFNIILKFFPAYVLELGNDEVYYWTYALYPDWSHFDHPPMVGWVIQFFSLNLLLQDEIFFRLGPIVLSSLSIWFLFFLVKKLYGSVAGFIAVGLFTASAYFNIISGLMIHPDTPQVFFIILAYKYLFAAFEKEGLSKKLDTRFLLASAFVGLAFLSKYHSLYIWFGIGIFVLLHARNWLKSWSLYVGLIITILSMVPVFYWNYQNDFASFAFHGERVGMFGDDVNWVSFLQFNAGQFAYQNPIVFVIFIAAIFWVFRNWPKNGGRRELLLLYLSFPPIILFTIFSLFQTTLPHWSGPGFLGLIILASKWLAAIYNTNKFRVKYTLIAANVLLFLAIYGAMAQVKTGFIRLTPQHEEITKLGQDDFTLDMYGWQHAKKEIENVLTEKSIDPQNVVFVSNKWFPAAHIDYYIASPLGASLIALGRLTDIHKYYWINKTRGFTEQNQLLYITTSRYYESPNYLVGHFDRIHASDTISILRNGKPVKHLFIFELSGYKGNLTHFNLPQPTKAPE